MYPLSYQLSWIVEESGYLHIQATKPDTIGIRCDYLVNDRQGMKYEFFKGTAVSASPIGLAAYILEKFSTGTNKNYKYRADGGLLEEHTLDDLLDNIMLYWITNSMTTGFRIYAEHFNKTNIQSGLEQ